MTPRPASFLAACATLSVVVATSASAGCTRGQVAAAETGAAAAPGIAAGSITTTAPGCALTVSPRRLRLPRAGGSATLTVIPVGSCPWTATSGLRWLTMDGAGKQTGPAAITVRAAANPGADRLGLVLLGGDLPVAVAQEGSGPVTTHPRLWLRAEDLPALRARARTDNPAYQALLAAGARQEEVFRETFFPGGKPARRWPDEGTGALADIYTEDSTSIFAFLSLVAPDEGQRKRWGDMARALLIPTLRQADQAGKGPFRGEFAKGERFRPAGDQWGLTVDWLYPRLSPKERALAARVFLRWSAWFAEETAFFRDRKLRNDRALLRGAESRWIVNNTFAGSVRNLMLGPLALDAADDPGGKLRAYLDEGIGNLLYIQSAVMGEGGDASGGVPVEGPWSYGAESTDALVGGLLALLTAGYVDFAKWGDQVGFMVGDRYLRDMVAFYRHLLEPRPGPVPEESDPGYEGPHGEQHPGPAFYDEWHMETHAPIGLAAALMGDVRLRDRVRWLMRDAALGGPKAFVERADKTSTLAILTFLLFDPALPAPGDYGSGLPLLFYARSQGRLVARSDWGPAAGWFGATCNWKTIDHQIETCGTFHFYVDGQWVTDPFNGYAGSGDADSPDYMNAMAIQNNPSSYEDWDAEYFRRGGQTRNNVGGPSHAAADHGELVVMTTDSTKLYNRKQDPVATDVVQGARSFVFLRPNVLVIHDRAESRSDRRWKRFWLNLPGAPQIKGRTLLATTTGPVKIRLDAVLPATARITSVPVEPLQGFGSLQLMKAHVRVTDGAEPKRVRLVNVLQGIGAGHRELVPVPLAGVAPAFDGVVVGQTALLFAGGREPADAAGVSYEIPSGVRRHVLVGLRPGARYRVSGLDGASLRITAGQGPEDAVVDSAGVLVLRAR